MKSLTRISKRFITGLNISREPEEIHRISNYFFVDYPFSISNPTVVKIVKKLVRIFELIFAFDRFTPLQYL